jgi:hypothetical protein
VGLAHELVGELKSHYGLAIGTGFDLAGKPPYEVVTLIQLDGDVVTRAHGCFFTDAALRERHFAQLDRKLLGLRAIIVAMRRTARLLRAGRIVLTVGAVTTGLVGGLGLARAEHHWFQFAEAGVGLVGIAMNTPLGRWVRERLARWVVRRAVARLTSTP